ncbi:MAG: CcoQ/FixQ family Cbb3-type cytochrome c oxidase assembly chaperone [Sneathiella sp.]|jgi:cytochrome c oxidase cbb3-type subunit 4|uniref:cbb3-type cytochrome oxidase subunit 3 n=1 Tax=Sneathiella sp. TaxID=1964365 RepID=UPI000C58569F|nr:cbb3-type cytochrome c oxidase subunit 3 [Sneathiella sp.]MAL80319.1 CcoQ/FixQ family Cbb3-type cytochrome c oxidase assembly chaperone [Sneathiella sp.]|tara:strand:+ start:1294 stop:1461 length:168 start_codon:yes stop_codon:yes gene_type:complete
MDFQSVSAFAQSYGLLYLFVLFIIVLIYALWPRNKDKFDKAARIPFEEDKDVQQG